MVSKAKEPRLSSELVARVLSKLGLDQNPTLDLDGLTSLYSAYCGSIPADNIQKRIWFSGKFPTPPPGGDPSEFFENWLGHGTGGTCFPINGAMYALAKALGFEARRIAGSMIVDGYTHCDNHGSVLVRLGGVDYLVDGQLAAFKVIELVPGRPVSSGEGIHDIEAVPISGGFDILWYSGVNRKEKKTFRIQPGYDPVDHAFFLNAYERTRKPGRDLFNHALYICRRFPDSIVTVVRQNKVTVNPDGSFSKTVIEGRDREKILVEEIGLSEVIVRSLPPDSDHVAAW